MPASPDTNTTCRRPFVASRNASAISAPSLARPTTTPGRDALSLAGTAVGSTALTDGVPIAAMKR